MKGFAKVVSCSIVILLAGCSASAPDTPGSSPVSASAAGGSGIVYGGSQPISNASIQLWTVGTTANASGATGLIPTGSFTAAGTANCVPVGQQVCYPTSVTTNGSGSFSLGGAFNCTSSPNQLVYLTATGGNPGLATGTNNTAIQLVTAVGPCSNLVSGSHWVLNEATTVASVYGLGGFISFTGSVGSTPANASNLSTAFTAASNLVNPNTGYPRLVTPDGTQVVPQAKLDTLANLLATCVNSTGSTASGQPCASLFAAVAGTTPTNVQQVAYDIANSPSSNVTGLFNLAPTNGPFQPTLSGAPANWTVTLTPVTALSITTTNIAAATVGLNYNQAFTATGGSGSYTWAIPSGSQLTALNNDGLGYNPSGSLNGTPTGPGSFPFTIQVTDVGTGQTASAPYTLTVNNAVLSQCTHDGSGNAILNGHYAFLLSGFDSTGNVLDQIGSFQANGAGSITNGLGDQNDSGYATQGEQSYTFSGTYSIGNTDDRGQMVLNVSNNTNPQYFCFVADTVTGGVAYSGRVIEATGDGTIQTGVFQIQNGADFTAGALTGGYAFGLQGMNSGSPLQRGGLVGQLTLNGSGGVSSGQVDIATYKSSSSSTDYTAAATLNSGGTYTMGSGGRGTLSISAGGGGATFIVYQFGNGSGFFMLSTANINTNTLLAGYALQQTQSSFTTANVAGKSVFREDGLDVSSGNGVDDAQIGQIGFDGSGGVSYLSDRNDGGNLTPASGVSAANYSVSSLGYVTIANSGNHPPSFYLYGPGGGFGLDSSSSVGLWVLVPQTGAGSFTSSSLNGSYGIGTVNPLGYSSNGAGVNSGNPYPDAFIASGTFNTGSLSLVQDEDQAPGTIPWVTTGETQSVPWTLDSTYGTTQGRFTAGGGEVTGYIVSPTQAILMTANSGKNPQVIVADHQ